MTTEGWVLVGVIVVVVSGVVVALFGGRFSARLRLWGVGVDADTSGRARRRGHRAAIRESESREGGAFAVSSGDAEIDSTKVQGDLIAFAGDDADDRERGKGGESGRRKSE
jgi:hypothetical protein